MKFTLSWLKDHLATEASVTDIAATLDRIGLEVEGITDPGAALKPFVIARIAAAKRHPDAEKLQICQVETGTETWDVICGAANARKGLIGVFAPIGTYVPGSKITLERRPIRGVVSNGMLCSFEELALPGESAGIIDLPKAAAKALGQSYVAWAGLDDPVIEIKITPNRPDCLGVRGIARDLAAAGLGTLKRADPGFTGDGTFKSPIGIRLDFPKGTEPLCPHFVGRLIRGVKNRPSPDWLAQRLTAIGLRPINALVDITNYISYDRCRPLHVYDAAKLKGAIGARLGRAGESFVGLDDKTHRIDERCCVIADEAAVLGLGGVMGGAASGSTLETTDVFIESAYFEPTAIARAGRATGITSDARYRFERGIDPASAQEGLALATKLILKICGGEPSTVVEAGRPKAEAAPIAFDPAEITRLTGLSLKEKNIRATLSALGFGVTGNGKTLTVTIPSFRPDIEGPADLVEEVVRLYGIDRVPGVPLPRPHAVATPVLTPAQKSSRRARRALAARGLSEAITWSFIAPHQASAFGGGQEGLTLDNPISAELAVMRPSLLPGLIAACQRNQDRGLPDCALFEVGQAFLGDKAGDQRTLTAVVRTGSATLLGAGRHWDGGATALQWADAKADAFALIASLALDPSKLTLTTDAPAWFHPGQSATLRLGPKTVIGHFGALHPSVLAAFDVTAPAVAAEIILDALPEQKRKGTQKPALEVSDFQPVRRDFAFLVDAERPASELIRAAANADKALIAAVQLFDVYEGQGVPAGKKSLALEVTLQPREKTLTDADIDQVSGAIIAAVAKATGAEIRG